MEEMKRLTMEEAAKLDSKASSDNYDYINPKHYDIFGREAIDILQKMLSPEEFKGFLFGNYMKYAFRLGSKKGEPTERDVEKMIWYRNKYNEVFGS
jgi:hypothetical protein